MKTGEEVNTLVGGRGGLEISGVGGRAKGRAAGQKNGRPKKRGQKCFGPGKMGGKKVLTLVKGAVKNGLMFKENKLKNLD